MKEAKDVIHEFNEVVNMTASELEKWLKSDDSNSAGWPKETEDGESVGHDSGRKIVEILKDNPDREPDKYTDDHIEHMRRVVAYCKRHLAQEEKTNSEKPDEEVVKTKSYASLKNWGHDFLKVRHGEDGGKNSGSNSKKKDEADDAGKEEEKAEKEDKEEEQVGDKRKKDADETSGSNKKRETDKGESNGTKKDDDDDDNDDKEADDKGEEKDEETANGKQANGHGKQDGDSNGHKEEQEKGGDDSGEVKNAPEKGDTVSWNWGSGQPEGKVLDVKPEKTTVTTKRGNEVSRDGDAEDPAVVLDTGKSKAIKSSHELNETSAEAN